MNTCDKRKFGCIVFCSSESAHQLGSGERDKKPKKKIEKVGVEKKGQGKGQTYGFRSCVLGLRLGLAHASSAIFTISHRLPQDPA